MSRKTKKNNVMYTLEDYRKLIKIWDKSDMEEIISELGFNKAQVGYMKTQLKEAGIKLTSKRQIGRTQIMLQQLKKEMGL